MQRWALMQLSLRLQGKGGEKWLRWCRWGGLCRRLLCRWPKPAPKNKNKGRRKTNGPSEQGHVYFPSFQKESQPFSPMEKTNTAMEISCHPGTSKSSWIGSYSYLHGPSLPHICFCFLWVRSPWWKIQDSEFGTFFGCLLSIHCPTYYFSLDAVLPGAMVASSCHDILKLLRK